MPRPIWSGAISFGLVSVPVRMLAATESREHTLVLETMYYADEVRRPEAVGRDASADGLRKAEVELAKSLVENLSVEFRPETYDDRYRKELLDLIRARAEGEELPESKEPEAEVVDLMQALRESVERTKRARAGGRSRAKKAS